MKNMEEQLEYQKQHYTDIINKLKTKLMLIKEKNQATFATFSKIMSNAMNLQIKCDCIQIVYETCSQTFIKVSNFEKICKQTDTNLNLKLENCKSNLSLNKENWKLLLFEWNDFQAQSNEISNIISKNIKKYININTSLDELILQNTNKLQHLNHDFQTIYQSKQKTKEIMISTEDILEKLKCTLTTIEKTRDTYITQINEQNTYERKLFTSIKDLDEKIEELRRKKIIIEPHEADNDDGISNYVHEFDLRTNKELKLNGILAEEKIKRIIKLEFDRIRLIQLRDTRIHTLKREEKEKVESQINMMNSELDDKQKLLDSVNKDMENTNEKISCFKKLFVEVVYVNNGLQDCTKVLLNCLQNVMIGNHGKTIDKLIQEELSATNVDYVEQLENLPKDSDQMEALLEERIQLLQERMKTITAQREQIEQANRGLEEELNKLSKNFVKIANNVKVTDETEDEKTK